MADLPKCKISPEQASYSVKPGKEVNATQLDGGMSRYRAIQLGATSLVTVQWTCGPVEHDYLWAFWRTTLKRGSRPFTLKMFLESSDLREYTCNIVPETFLLQSKKGLTFYMVATLEVMPLPTDDGADQLILAAMQDENE